MSVKKFYCRVSTDNQNSDDTVQNQLNQAKLLDIKKNHIYYDVCSGDTFDRPEYQRMKQELNKGDILYITKPDRFGRNYLEAIKELEEIESKTGTLIQFLNLKYTYDDNVSFRHNQLYRNKMLSIALINAEIVLLNLRTGTKEGMNKLETNEKGQKVGKSGNVVGHPLGENARKFQELYPLYKELDKDEEFIRDEILKEFNLENIKPDKNGNYFKYYNKVKFDYFEREKRFKFFVMYSELIQTDLDEYAIKWTLINELNIKPAKYNNLRKRFKELELDLD